MSSIIIPSDQLSDDDKQQMYNAHPLQKKIINMTDAEYFADTTHVTNTHLKVLKKGGPLHLLKHFRAVANREQDDEQKSHFVWGSAFHCAVLEPDQYFNRFYTLNDNKICAEIGGKSPRLTNKYKEWKLEQEMQNSGKTPLALSDYNDIMRIRDKVHLLPQSRELLSHATLKEKVFKSNMDGLNVKCKADGVNQGNYALDLKSTKDSPTFANFLKDFEYMDYNMQSAFYTDILGVFDFWFIVCEKTAPYTVGVYHVSELSLHLGRKKYQDQIKEYNRYFGPNKKFDENNFYYSGEC